MAEIILNIKKKDVYNEVAKISSYVGAKSEKNNEDTDMYARVFATDSDREMLDRFWEDCCGSRRTSKVYRGYCKCRHRRSFSHSRIFV